MRRILRKGPVLLALVVLSACGRGGSLPSSTTEVGEEVTVVSGTSCGALAAPTTETSEVSTAAELVRAVRNANRTGGNRTIRLATGTYTLRQTLVITAPNISIRSATGQRGDVVLRGAGMNGGVPHIFLVQADRFTVADLTLGWVANHGIQIQGERDADDLLVHNVRFVDTGEQMLKVTYRKAKPTVRSDRGVIRCSLFEYSAGIAPQWYVGGIDAHNGGDWEVRDNVFRGIRSPESRLAEHAIHFWSGSSNTLVERNLIVDCDRGIGFGLGTSTHVGGLIRNNMVYTTRDAGISLESATGTRVLHNSVYTEGYGNAIEYRFAATRDVIIRGNLTHGAIQSRNGAGGTADSNYTNATPAFFVDYASGDLHLSSARAEVVNQAPTPAEVTDDIDCRARPVTVAPDLGAHEWEGKK